MHILNDFLAKHKKSKLAYANWNVIKGDFNDYLSLFY